jgi:WD40 repeat protein/tRNA A-37 threonylcarbamoyl transferase component Bud32
MKTCPQCDSGYPDSHTTCPTHGVMLNEIRDLKPGMLIRQSYRITRKLGQGGMGAVYLAQHILMDESRALKFLSSELSRDQAFTARFLREVRTLRQIRNHNVVDCGDLEAAEDGSLFFSMEFVDGPDLRAFLHDPSQYQQNDCHPERSAAEPGSPATGLRRWGGESKDLRLPLGALPVELALSITRQIAEGLGAAHAKGMVHRDIKPENILMVRDGDSWLPKIADFGIVATKESSTAYTRTGGTLLTMAYAAPEQWRGTPAAELDGRTDLYALGGLLYEMLTGQTPFHAENYEGWSRQHQTTPPQPPSTFRPDLANWQGLEALVLRLLAKDREDRPKNVAELLKLLDAVVYLPPQPVRVPTIPDSTPRKAPPAATLPVSAPAAQPPMPNPLPDHASPKRHTRRFSLWVWVALTVLLLATGYGAGWLLMLHPGMPQPRTLKSPNSTPSFVAFSPDGRILASGDDGSTSKTANLWDVASGQVVRTLGGHGNGVYSAAFSSDGHTFASGDGEGTVRLWNLATGKLLYTMPVHSSNVSSIVFSPDGRTLASGSFDSSIVLSDVASGKKLRTLLNADAMVNSIAFNYNGHMLASGGTDNTIKLWDVATGKVVRTLQGHTGIVDTVVFTSDGRTLVSGSRDESIKLWDVNSGRLKRTLDAQSGTIYSVALSPDDRTLASGSDDSTVKLWDMDSGKVVRSLRGHSKIVVSVVFSPDGRTLASGSWDGTIKLWDVADLKK